MLIPLLYWTVLNACTPRCYPILPLVNFLCSSGEIFRLLFVINQVSLAFSASQCGYDTVCTTTRSIAQHETSWLHRDTTAAACSCRYSLTNPAAASDSTWRLATKRGIERGGWLRNVFGPTAASSAGFASLHPSPLYAILRLPRLLSISCLLDVVLEIYILL